MLTIILDITNRSCHAVFCKQTDVMMA